MEIVEINGIKYGFVPEEKKPSQTSRKGNMAMLGVLALSAASMYSSEYGGASKEKEWTVNLDELVSEFTLIQQKKSTLTKSKRDWIERQFHKKFTKID